MKEGTGTLQGIQEPSFNLVKSNALCEDVVCAARIISGVESELNATPASLFPFLKKRKQWRENQNPFSC